MNTDLVFPDRLTPQDQITIMASYGVTKLIAKITELGNFCRIRRVNEQIIYV